MRPTNSDFFVLYWNLTFIEINVIYTISSVTYRNYCCKPFSISFYQIADVYDSSKEQMMIGPCRWTPNTDLAFWLDEDDETILQVITKLNSFIIKLNLTFCIILNDDLSIKQYLSTSPYAEPPHFVQHIKSTIRFLLEHPSPHALFPGGQPQLFQRSEQGEWERVCP